MIHNTEKTYELTCKDLQYTGVICCDTCHEDHFSQYELTVALIDNKPALICCAMRAFFYPDDPNVGFTPEEKLLRAIFGEKAQHDQKQEDNF